MSPHMEPASPTESGIRKRVCKACDRCRLKKSKCDGASPCSRCKADNAICFFGERKKSHDKIYPKGYVEMLEGQQAQLVAGLQELYKRLQNGQGWEGAPLKETANGLPLTHDILERLGSLKQEDSLSADHFEENLETLQQRLIANGALPMQRQASFDTISESDYSPQYEPKSRKAMSFVNPFAGVQLPPTPPVQSSFVSSTRTTSPLRTQFTFDTVQTPQLAAYTPEYVDEMDFMTYEAPNNALLDPTAFTHPMYQNQDAINPCLTMKNWDSLQDMQRHYTHPNVYA